MSALGLGDYSSSDDDVQSVTHNDGGKVPSDRPDEWKAVGQSATIVTPEPALGPAAGPMTAPYSTDADPYPEVDDHSATPVPPGAASPYTSTRQTLRRLTLPTLPVLDIPPSPPGSPPRETTAKFVRFLQLKEQGVHFNKRLEESAALRNPALGRKLLAFAGVIGDGKEDARGQYESLPGFVPEFPDWMYADKVVEAYAEMDRREENERTGRPREFVPAKPQNDRN